MLMLFCLGLQAASESGAQGKYQVWYNKHAGCLIATHQKGPITTTVIKYNKKGGIVLDVFATQRHAAAKENNFYGRRDSGEKCFYTLADPDPKVVAFLKNKMNARRDR